MMLLTAAVDAPTGILLVASEAAMLVVSVEPELRV